MKNNRKLNRVTLLVTWILISLVFSAASGFASSWINFEGNPAGQNQPEWLVEQERNNQVEIELNLPGMSVGEVVERSTNFHIVDIPGAVVEGIPGTPPVYCLRRFVLVPPEGEVTIEIEAGEPQVLTGYQLYPAQPPLLEGEVKPFAYDEESYREDKWYPGELVEISEEEYYREWRLVRVTVHPLQFNPAVGSMRVYPRIIVRVSTEVEKDAGVGSYSYPIQPDTILSRLAVNAGYFEKGEVTEKILDGVEYLMIAAPTYSGDSNLQELVDYYNNKGVTTSLVSTSETGTTVQQIKSYIQSVYDASGVLRFVLLVGSINEIPYYTHSSIPGDYHYSLLSGSDEIPDVSLGRFSVKNTTELERMVQNSLNYNRGYPGGDWYSRIALVAHRQEYPGKYTACKENIYNSLQNSNFQVQKIYGGAGGSNADVTDAFRNGVGIVNYRGHGDDYVWQPWDTNSAAWTKSNVGALNSGDYRPLVIGSACNNGNYLVSNRCLAEEFVLCETGGACGYWGSTKPSYTVSNHTMDEEIFAAMIPPYEISNIGEALQYSLIKLVEQYTGDLRLNIWMFVWFGDPYIPIYDKEPAPTPTPSPTPIPYEIITDQLPSGTVGAKYLALLEAAGGVSPFTWSIAGGVLPGGLSLNAISGAISGVPQYSSVGSNNFRARVVDSSGFPGGGEEKDFDIYVFLKPLKLVDVLPADGVLSTFYNYTFKATGGSEPYAWSIVEGNLPTGLILDPSTGNVSGQPIEVETGLFTIAVEDSQFVPAREEISTAIHINQPNRALVDNFINDHSEEDEPGARDGFWWDRGNARTYQLSVSTEVYRSGGAALKVDWAKAGAWDQFQFDLIGDVANFTNWYAPEAGKEAVTEFSVRSSVPGVKLRFWLATGESSDQLTFPSDNYLIEEDEVWQTIRVDWKTLNNGNDFRRVRKLRLIVNPGEIGGSGTLYLDDFYVMIGEEPSATPTPPPGPPGPTATPRPGRTPTPAPSPTVEPTLTPQLSPTSTATPVPDPSSTPQPSPPEPTVTPGFTPMPSVTPTVPLPPTATPTAAPPPEYEDWIAQYPGVGSESGPLDDPDGDGWNNLAEYQLNLMTGRESDPSDPGSGGQAVPLSPGWNLISITVGRCWYDSHQTGGEPPSVAGEFVDVAGAPPAWGQVFESIEGEYELVLNQMAGDSTFNPTLPWISTLDWIGPDKGFWIKMKEEGQLVLKGSRVERTGGGYPPLPLAAGSEYAGWTLLPFLPGNLFYTAGIASCGPAPSDLTGEAPSVTVSETLNYALNMDGETWDQVERIQTIYPPPTGGVAYRRGLPEGFQSLRFLMPGYGIWIKMDETYPGGSVTYREP